MTGFAAHLENVSKSYRGKVRALDDATLALPEGARVCLLGPNGAGKTTLLRLLTGALEPSSGSIRLFGLLPSDRDFPAAKRRVGFVPQSPGMYRDLSVTEYLQLVRDIYGRGNVSDAIESFGLGKYRAQNMSELSGGWQRKLVLAASLIADPDLLLLDEPTVGLDPVATREVHSVLRDSMAKRTTLLCTHNLAEAEALCDTVAVLREGRVLALERIDVLRAKLPHRVLLRANESVEVLAQQLRSEGHTPMIYEDSVQISLENAAQKTSALLEKLFSAGLHPFECRIEQPSLEELFIAVLGAHDHAV